MHRTPVRIIRWQLGVTLLGAIAWSLVGGLDSALGALVGGGISVLLSTYAAVKVFSVSAEDPQAVLAAFFRAEALKLVLAAVLLSIAVILFRELFAEIITTLAATLTIYWFALLWRSDDEGTKTG